MCFLYGPPCCCRPSIPQTRHVSISPAAAMKLEAFLWPPPRSADDTIVVSASPMLRRLTLYLDWSSIAVCKRHDVCHAYQKRQTDVCQQVLPMLHFADPWPADDFDFLPTLQLEADTCGTHLNVDNSANWSKASGFRLGSKGTADLGPKL